MRNMISCVFLFSLVVLFFVSCEREQDADEVKRDYRAEADAVYASCVSMDECYLCSGIAEYEGQNNVGIISLNTFQFMPVEINQYEQGQLIEENIGSMLALFHNSQDDGFSASLLLHADRGRATASVSFNADEELDFANTAQHLCMEHLSRLADGLYRNVYGVGIINFSAKKLYVICDGTLGFESDDYYVDCRLKEDGLGADLLIVYTPLRYGNCTRLLDSTD